MPQDDASITITNLGFTRGYAAFELFRTYGFTPFYLKEHLARFEQSAKALLLNFPTHVKEIVLELLEKNRHPDLVVRFYLSEDERGTSQFLILSDPIILPPEHHYQNGIPIITTKLTRQFHLIKSTSYLSAIIATKEALKLGADDALFTSSNGELLELTKSNFFAVIDGVLYTPKEGILFGITRQIVINLSKDLGIPLIEGPIQLSAISQFEEAFSTSTIREILPISKIDGHQIPLGPITKALQQVFHQSPAAATFY